MMKKYLLATLLILTADLGMFAGEEQSSPTLAQYPPGGKQVDTDFLRDALGTYLEYRKEEKREERAEEAEERAWDREVERERWRRQQREKEEPSTDHHYYYYGQEEDQSGNDVIGDDDAVDEPIDDQDELEEGEDQAASGTVRGRELPLAFKITSVTANNNRNGLVLVVENPSGRNISSNMHFEVTNQATGSTQSGDVEKTLVSGRSTITVITGPLEPGTNDVIIKFDNSTFFDNSIDIPLTAEEINFSEEAFYAQNRALNAKNAAEGAAERAKNAKDAALHARDTNQLEKVENANQAAQDARAAATDAAGYANAATQHWQAARDAAAHIPNDETAQGYVDAANRYRELAGAAATQANIDADLAQEYANATKPHPLEGVNLHEELPNGSVYPPPSRGKPAGLEFSSFYICINHTCTERGIIFSPRAPIYLQLVFKNLLYGKEGQEGAYIFLLRNKASGEEVSRTTPMPYEFMKSGVRYATLPGSFSAPTEPGVYTVEFYFQTPFQQGRPQNLLFARKDIRVSGG